MPGLFHATTRLDCALTLLPGAPPLRSHARVHFHCGTAEIMASVVLLEDKELGPGASAFAQFHLAEPGLFVWGDRFIIRQFSPVTTIGGGSVLDTQPARHRMGDATTLEFWRALERGGPEERLGVLTAQAGEITAAALAGRLGWSTLDLLRVARSLTPPDRLQLLGQPPTLVVHGTYWERMANRVLQELEGFHTANPLAEGLPKEELRAKLDGGTTASSPPSTALFNALLQTLLAQGKVDLQGESIRLSGRQVQLSPEEMAAREQINAAFQKAGLTVPAAGEVLAGLRIDRGRAEKLLRILLKEKTLLKVTEDLIFHASALRELRDILARRKATTKRLSVPGFKELTGLTRKYAIPLLEYLDRERVTRREGDERIIL